MKHRPTYTLLDQCMASGTEPMTPEQRRHQLTRMNQGLLALERHPEPTRDDWRVVSDAVNLMETLVGMRELIDASGLLADAAAAMAQAGRRHQAKGTAIRLDAIGLEAVRSILIDYTAAIEALPARTMIRAHRATEKRIREIHSGKKRPHDIEVITL